MHQESLKTLKIHKQLLENIKACFIQIKIFVYHLFRKGCLNIILKCPNNILKHYKDIKKHAHTKIVPPIKICFI